MAYREDVAFLEESSPPLIEQTAAEYGRLRALMASCESDFRRSGQVEWESEHLEKYARRLREATGLAEYLSDAFRRVSAALDAYAKEVERARAHFEYGQESESRLAEVMAREATPITPETRAAEPLRLWEDLRETTGVLEWLAELTVDLDAIREEAEHFYDATHGHYADAQRVESEAREDCVHEIGAALRSLPEFRSERGGDFASPTELLSGVGALRREAAAAAHDPNAQLPGTGSKVDTIPAAGPHAVAAPNLQRIKKHAARKRDDGSGRDRRQGPGPERE